jgi:TusA-related sulfurtransferase
MGNCPTALPGATTAIADVDGGVEVTVTGPDPATGTQIRERMQKLAEAARSDADGGHVHNHSGSGGGRMGRCTIVIRNTTLATADVPNGTKITVQPKDKKELDWLRRETRDRDREAKAAGSEGAGVQRMAHCPSAVDGAKTAVKDAKDGVIVTVTATDASKVTEIRQRAQHTAEVAKKGDVARPKHSGDGTGGGGLGRCPIVVEGETTVTVKDVEGGAEIAVSTKKDPSELQKETRTRAENFAAN